MEGNTDEQRWGGHRPGPPYKGLEDRIEELEEQLEKWKECANDLYMAIKQVPLNIHSYNQTSKEKVEQQVRQGLLAMLQYEEAIKEQP